MAPKVRWDRKRRIPYINEEMAFYRPHYSGIRPKWFTKEYIIKADLPYDYPDTQCKREWALWKKLENDPDGRHFLPILKFGTIKVYHKDYGGYISMDWILQKRVKIIHKHLLHDSVAEDAEMIEMIAEKWKVGDTDPDDGEFPPRMRNWGYIAGVPMIYDYGCVL